MRLKVERAGVLLVETLEELGDVAEMVLRIPAPAPGGAAVICESGAFKALTLDLAEREALPLPPLGDADSPALRAALPDFVPVSNPLDVTAQGLVDPDLYARVLTALIGDDRVQSVLLAIIQTDAVTAKLKFPPILAAIEALQPTKRVVFAGLDEGAVVPPDYVDRLRALNVPYFPSAERAVRALARLGRWSGAVSASPTSQPAGTAAFAGLAGVIPEWRAKLALTSIGIPFPQGALATTPAEAVAIAAKIGYPVAIKAQSAELAHKSDVGGVIVGLRDEAALKAGWAKLIDNVGRSRPGLALDGVLVEAMGAPGVELIVGGRKDPEWGPVVVVGFGGVQAEILRTLASWRRMRTSLKFWRNSRHSRAPRSSKAFAVRRRSTSKPWSGLCAPSAACSSTNRRSARSISIRSSSIRAAKGRSRSTRSSSHRVEAGLMRGCDPLAEVRRPQRFRLGAGAGGAGERN